MDRLRVTAAFVFLIVFLMIVRDRQRMTAIGNVFLTIFFYVRKPLRPIRD
jgi:hypothetical protein